MASKQNQKVMAQAQRQADDANNRAKAVKTAQGAYGPDIFAGTGINPMMSPAQNRVAQNQAQTQTYAAQYAKDRAKDMAAGRKRGEELFGNKALGSVAEQRSGAAADVLARRQQQLSGYTPEERNLLNSQYMTELNQQFGGQVLEARRLAQAGGLRGPAAAALAQRSLADQAGARANLQRDLFLQEQGQKRDALGGYEKSLSDIEAKELERQVFNMGQREKEKLGIIGTEMGFSGLGSGDRAAASQMIAGDRQADLLRQLLMKG